MSCLIIEQAIMVRTTAAIASPDDVLLKLDILEFGVVASQNEAVKVTSNMIARAHF